MPAQRIVPLVFLGLSLAYGVLALFLENDLPGAGSAFGPRTFPLGLAAAGTVLSLLLLRERLRETDLSHLAWARLARLCALMTLYALAIGRVGLLLSTILFLASGCILLGERRPRMVFAVAVGTAVVFEILLTQLLGVYVEEPLLQSLGIQ